MKKETKVQGAKKRVTAKKKKSSSLAVKDRILTYEGMKRKQITLKKKGGASK